MQKKAVNRNTWAKIGQVLTIIAGILVIIIGILMFIGTSYLGSIGNFGFFHLNTVVLGVIDLIVGIFYIVLELDYISMPSHLVRGIVIIVVALLLGGGIFALLGGIFYVIAEFVK